MIGVTFSKNDHDYCLLYQFLGWEYSFNLPDFDFTLGEVYATNEYTATRKFRPDYGSLIERGRFIQTNRIPTNELVYNTGHCSSAAGIGTHGIGACYLGASRLERGDLCDLVTGGTSHLDSEDRSTTVTGRRSGCYWVFFVEHDLNIL